VLHANEDAAAELRLTQILRILACACVSVPHATALAKLKLLHNKQRKLSEEPAVAGGRWKRKMAAGKCWENGMEWVGMGSKE